MIIRRIVPEGTSDRYREGEFSKDYTVLNELGRGRFAVVRRCEHVPSKQHFAAKFIRKRRMGRDCKEDILKEIKILEMSMEHPRLITLHEIYETAHEVILVLEFAVGGELHPYCVAERDGSFTERDAIRLLLQIVEGIKYLHDQDIVHLDIKPQNILLTEEEVRAGDIKLIDFGFARWMNKDHEVREIVGTVDYVAPEVLNYEPITLATDMWSVGVVAYVMLTGVSPFAGDTKQETYLNISQGNLDFPEEYFKDVSLEAQDLIKSLCVLEPEERLTAAECIKHPLFTNHISEGTLHSSVMDMNVTETDMHVVDHHSTVNSDVNGFPVDPHNQETSGSPVYPSTESKLIIPNFAKGQISEYLSGESGDPTSSDDVEGEGDHNKMQVDHHISTKVIEVETVPQNGRTVISGDIDVHPMNNEFPTRDRFDFVKEDPIPIANGQCSSSKFLHFKYSEGGKEASPSMSLKHQLSVEEFPGPFSSTSGPDTDRENRQSPEPKRPKMETTSMVVSS